MTVHISASVTFFISLAFQHLWIDALNRHSSTKCCDVSHYSSLCKGFTLSFLHLGKKNITSFLLRIISPQPVHH